MRPEEAMTRTLVKGHPFSDRKITSRFRRPMRGMGDMGVMS